MARFWIFIGVMMAAMLLLFFVIQALDLPFLAENTDFLLSQEKWLAPFIGTGLLIADVVAPVPSSIIMFANGILFGVVWGSLLSLVGGLGATATGFWLGSRGESFARRFAGEESIRRSEHFFQKHGTIALIVSRPVPILAETLSIVAGMSGMPLKKVLWSSFLGYLPAVVLYAVAGAYATDWNTGLIAFGVVMGIATLVWLVGRLILQRNSPAPSQD